MNNYIKNSRDSDDEKSTNNGKIKVTPNPNNLTTSSWTKLRDPRIVRVSRAFGGKDRHSKVCTVRGLRDRRVRLSVPTAIQLYDLQDRLGLNQPSKVVDWLLDVAKHEIDELPPLQIPSGNFQNLQSMFNVANASQSDVVNGVNWEDYWNINQDKANKAMMNKDHFFVQSSAQVVSSSLPGVFNNGVPNGSFLKLNPSNFESYGSIAHDHQENTSHNYLSSSHFMYPHDHHHNNSRDDDQFDPKRLNFEMLSSSSSSSHHHHNHALSSSSSHLYTINQGTMGRPFHLSMNPNQEHEQDEGN